MWNPRHYRRLVRASAGYDLIVTVAFSTPWTFALLHGALQGIARALDLPGELGDFGPVQVLMANLMGSIVCVWSVLRIRDPQRRYGRYDAAGRGLFALWQAYALSQGASLVLLPFLLAEIAWGVAQALPVRHHAHLRGEE
ncbi:hypothetical protein [Pseudomonas sp. RIT-PI-AD]|uniref:hypothetical protein n=1 Tax=Pseudomonas sp. RIT-PI-AD TaxID=3035294 RepID=UPI0021DB11C9|nr:hypothetical protein [Pseudomonas sp. RIT-PI-AD]